MDQIIGNLYAQKIILAVLAQNLAASSPAGTTEALKNMGENAAELLKIHLSGRGPETAKVDAETGKAITDIIQLAASIQSLRTHGSH